MKTLILALRSVFQSPGYRAIGAGSFLVFLAINIVTLSSPFADAQLPTSLLQDINVTVILKSALLAVLLGLLTPITVYLLRQRMKAHLAVSTTGLLCSGVCCLAGPLCCGALYLFLSWFAGLIPAAAGVTAHIYTFLGTYEDPFYYISIALLAYALYTNTRKIAAGQRHAASSLIEPAPDKLQ